MTWMALFMRLSRLPPLLNLSDLCLIHIYWTDSVAIYRYAKHLPDIWESWEENIEKMKTYFIAYCFRFCVSSRGAFIDSAMRLFWTGLEEKWDWKGNKSWFKGVEVDVWRLILFLKFYVHFGFQTIELAGYLNCSRLYDIVDQNVAMVFFT